jgi:hypothetical protein
MADEHQQDKQTRDVDFGMGIILAAILVPVAVIHIAAALS